MQRIIQIHEKSGLIYPQILLRNRIWPLTDGTYYPLFPNNQNNQLDNFSFTTTTRGSLFVDRGSLFADRRSLFANCFYDLQSTISELRTANPEQRTAIDDKRYSQPYQPFYFYDYDKEDFLRLKNNLIQVSPSLDETTQLQINHLLYLVDRTLRHGSYDSKDVYFASKVDSLAFALNDMASHQETNILFLGSIDPMLVVPNDPANSVYDLDHLNVFWDFLDKVLQGDFNSKSPEEIVKELDAALVADLGNQPHFLDEPTKDVLRAVLKTLEDGLSSEYFCSDTDLAQITKIQEIIDTIKQALFWAYNVSNPSERALHSQFNPNPFYARPPMVLMDVLSVENALTIIHTTPANDIDYNEVYHHLDNLYQTLAALHYAIIDFGDEVDLETYTRDQWNDLVVLKILRSVYPELSKQALEVNRDYPEPIFGIPQEEFERQILFLQKQLEERIAEIEANITPPIPLLN